MTYKLLVTDLDSTLLSSQRTLSSRTLRAFETAKQQGKLVTFATGRNYQSTLPMIEQLVPNAPVILYNGARVEETPTRDLVYTRDLPYQHAQKAFALNLHYRISLLMYLDDEIYVETLTPEVHEFMAKEKIVCHAVGDLQIFLGQRDRCPRP